MFDAWLHLRVRKEHKPPTCTRGCCACCDLSVAVSWAEACLVDGAKDRIPNRDLEKWTKRVIALSHRLPDGEDFSKAYRDEIGPCPFLDTGGACGIHAFRPLACRMLVSELSPRYCTRNYAASVDEEEHRALLTWQEGKDSIGPWLAEPVREARRIEKTLHRETIRTYGTSLRGSLPVMLTLIGEGVEPGMELPYWTPLVDIVSRTDVEMRGSAP